MWQARSWQDLSVNVNFEATSNEQNASFTELPLLFKHDAIRPEQIRRAVSEHNGAREGLCAGLRNTSS